MLYWSVTIRNIHKRPSARQIQPMGLWGRLEAMRAPTIGKARKGTKLTISLAAPTVTKLPGDCADRARAYSAPPTTNMATQSAASAHASHAAARALMPSMPCPAFLLLLSQPHFTGGPSLKRYDDRYEERSTESASRTSGTPSRRKSHPSSSRSTIFPQMKPLREEGYPGQLYPNMASGKYEETIQFGWSTISEILRSTTRLASTYASTGSRP